MPHLLWTQWLYREYDQINAYYRLNLCRPIIAVTHLKNRLGSWDSFLRTITIQSDAIRKYPWNEVVNILKHEMAHQMVTERGGGPERAHGIAFQAACKKMGLPDWAIRASGDLPNAVPDWRQSVLSQDEQRLLSKAQKLLALASSDNENEASLAVQRVRELYAKYNLDQVQQQKEARFVSWIVCRKKRRMPVWESIILSILNRHFFVRVIHLKQFDAQDCVQYAAAEVMGKKQNVLMAEYVYQFLVRTLESLWSRSGGGGKERRTYFLGVLQGFESQLDRSKEASIAGLGGSDSKALALAVDRELDRVFASKYPRIQSGGRARVDCGSVTYQQGKKDGEKIRLNKPIANQDGNRGLLLS